MPPDLLSIVEDFERLWNVEGFAEAFAARLATPPAHDTPEDAFDLVLAENRRLLVAALRHGQARGEIRSEVDAGQLASALVGVYLARRLAGDDLGAWARAAIATVLKN